MCDLDNVISDMRTVETLGKSLSLFYPGLLISFIISHIYLKQNSELQVKK